MALPMGDRTLNRSRHQLMVCAFSFIITFATQHTSFQGADLTNATFLQAKLGNTNFAKARLENANFRGAKI